MCIPIELEGLVLGQTRFSSMFIDLTHPERDRFIKEASGCHIPGYTGHCPTLKFRHGKRYGANTREIIEELKDRPVTHNMRPYKHDDPGNSLFKETRREPGDHYDPTVLTALPKRAYVLGYTGFIPGLNFQYGSSFSSAAEKSVHEFSFRLADEERKREKARLECIDTEPRVSCVRSRDEVSKVLDYYTENVSKKPELPPIAGYTGHIPRLKGNESSLSQRYYSAAQSGLALLREERNERQKLNIAKKKVKEALAFSHAQRLTAI